MIHVIGDSHCCVWVCNGILLHYPYVRVSPCGRFSGYHIGPHLAWTLPDRFAQNMEILTKHAHSGDKVVLVHGEIDCRCHIVKQARERHVAIQTVARACAERYVQGAAVLQQASGLKMWICTPEAQTPADLGGAYPTVGTHAERQHATMAFVGGLVDFCPPVGIGVVDLLGRTMNLDQSTDLNMYAGADNVHLLWTPAFPMIVEQATKSGLL